MPLKSVSVEGREGGERNEAYHDELMMPLMMSMLLDHWKCAKMRRCRQAYGWKMEDGREECEDGQMDDGMGMEV